MELSGPAGPSGSVARGTTRVSAIAPASTASESGAGWSAISSAASTSSRARSSRSPLSIACTTVSAAARLPPKALAFACAAARIAARFSFLCGSAKVPVAMARVVGAAAAAISAAASGLSPRSRACRARACKTSFATASTCPKCAAQCIAVHPPSHVHSIAGRPSSSTMRSLMRRRRATTLSSPLNAASCSGVTPLAVVQRIGGTLRSRPPTLRSRSRARFVSAMSIVKDVRGSESNCEQDSRKM
jgi:hypothetical protein